MKVTDNPVLQDMVEYVSAKDKMSGILFKCAGCRWFRALTKDPVERKKRMRHPVYGLVTYEVMAAADIRNHDCREYEMAVERLRNAA